MPAKDTGKADDGKGTIDKILKTGKGSLNGYTFDGRLVAPSGSRTSHIGHSKREGVSSIFDQGIIEENARRQNMIMGKHAKTINIGDNGYEVWNQNGRVHIANSKGNITLVDRSFLEREKRLREEAEAYTTEILSFLVYDDQLAIDCLNISKEEYISNFGTRTKDTPYRANGVEVPGALAEGNATAAYLNAVPQGSREYSIGIAKLRFLVQRCGYMPILDGDTGTASIVEKDNI